MAGENTVVPYLEVALDNAKRGQWLAAKLNAEEAAQYADMAERTSGLSDSAGGRDQ